VPFFDHAPVSRDPKIGPVFSCFFVFFRVFSTFLRFEHNPFKSRFPGFSRDLALQTPKSVPKPPKSGPYPGQTPVSDPSEACFWHLWDPIWTSYDHPCTHSMVIYRPILITLMTIIVFIQWSSIGLYL